MRLRSARNDSTSAPHPYRPEPRGRESAACRPDPRGRETAATWWLLLLVGVALHLAACGGDKTTQPPPNSGRVWHATPDGTGSDCGNLQGCLDVAASTDTIELAGGLYDTVGDTLVAGTCTSLPQVTNGICRKSVVVRPARGATVVIDGRGEPGRVGLTVPADVSDVTIENITFTNCWAGVGTAGGKATLRNCTFSVGDHGLEAHETLLDIRDCTFENHSQESINLRNCSGSVQRVTVIGSGAGLASRGGRNLTVSHAQFGPFCAGGVLALESGALTLANCTILGAGMLPGMPDSNGVTVRRGASVTINSCIISGNRGYGVFCEQDEISAPAATLNCSDVFGNLKANYGGCADATGQRGNISADPLFCDPGGFHYQLKPVSPARAGCGVMGAYAEACGAAAPMFTRALRARE